MGVFPTMLVDHCRSPLLEGRPDGPTGDEVESLRATYGEYLARLSALSARFSDTVEFLAEAA